MIEKAWLIYRGPEVLGVGYRHANGTYAFRKVTSMHDPEVIRLLGMRHPPGDQLRGHQFWAAPPRSGSRDALP